MSNPFAVAQKYIEQRISDDPVLYADQWYPDFRDFHHKVIAETRDFDFEWVRENRPQLYRAIKTKEKEIDALGAASLSHVLALLREWREMILVAEFERQQFAR